ncbi:MAG TPA: FAD-dependent oxidoreductase, partial [Pseudomonadales bacterium]
MSNALGIEDVDVAIIGAGSIGIAVAYYLATRHRLTSIALIDQQPPMTLTSARSGENYRNWWPHPTMTAFTDHSISLMEDLDRASGGRLNMTRGGYALVTRRAQPDELIEALFRGYGDDRSRIRLHESAAGRYRPPQHHPWRDAPDGVDVLLDRALIRRTFPGYAHDIASVVHVRRAGSLSGQQLGQYMLECLRRSGLRIHRTEVRGIEAGSPFILHLDSNHGRGQLRARRLVNAAGPLLANVGRLLGETLPVRCVYQQKIAFEDRERVIARELPFTIDLDPQTLDWSPDERTLLAAEPATRSLLETMPGGIHCRPDGPPGGTWVKLGWAYNQTPSDPQHSEPLDPHFPDMVLRGASRLHRGLAADLGRLPRGA